MSSRNPYANATNDGYSNPSTAARYGDLYAQDNNPPTGSVNGYASRERRPGGYGGLGPTPDEESSQRPPSHARYGVEEDVGYSRRPARDNRDQNYNDSSRSRERATPKTNGMASAAGYTSRKGQRSMEGESYAIIEKDLPTGNGSSG